MTRGGNATVSGALADARRLEASFSDVLDDARSFLEEARAS
jgi:hypothetical protein